VALSRARSDAADLAAGIRGPLTRLFDIAYAVYRKPEPFPARFKMLGSFVDRKVWWKFRELGWQFRGKFQTDGPGTLKKIDSGLIVSQSGALLCS
jgi:hypothetical protein